MAPHVALVTEQRFVHPIRPDWYVRQILTEDALVAEALSTLGIRSKRVDWANAAVRWDAFDAVIFRTPWDYFHRATEFSTWLSRCEGRARFINPIPQVRWNMDKHYLHDLNQRGIAIPPTEFIKKGEAHTLAQIVESCGWERAVLKPTVSGAGRHTYLIDSSNVADDENLFHSLIAHEDMMLQQFLPSITQRGEVALMVMDGRFTHAVLKTAKPGDFRVQDDFGGTTGPYQATPVEVAFAEKVVSLCDPLPAYARVDVMWDTAGLPVVSELELIEPELWFRHCPAAAYAFAQAIVRRL